MSNILVHGLQTKRIQRLGWVNYTFLIGAPVFTIFSVGIAKSPWYLLFLLLTLPGIPIKDYGNVFSWLALHAQAQQIWNRKDGVTEAQPVLRNATSKKKKKEPVITWQDTSTVLVSFVNAQGNVMQVPFLHNDGFLSALLLDDGVSEETLESNVEERFYDDLSLIRESVLALCKTRQPDLIYGSAYLKIPADPTKGFEFNRRRGNRDLQAAMTGTTPTNQYDAVDIKVAQHAIEVHDSGYNNAGQGYNLSWIRMPYPVNRFGRKIDLTKPHKVRKTDLVRTVTELMRAYSACGIHARLMTESELNGLLLTGLKLKELPTIFTQLQRDRELVARRMVKNSSETPGAKRNSWRPRTTSFRYDQEQAMGYMVVDGTYVAAGHVDKLTRENQPGGFMSQLFRVPADICYGFVTIIDAPFVGYEKVKAREKERWTKVAKSLLSFDDNLSTPEHDIRLQEIVEFRRRLAESSNRAGNYTNILVVMSDSAEALRFDWDDVVSSLARAYQFEQVHLPAQIANWVKAVFGILPK